MTYHVSGNSSIPVSHDLVTSEKSSPSTAEGANNTFPNNTLFEKSANSSNGEFAVRHKSSGAVQDHEVDQNLLKPLWFARMIVKCPFLLCSAIIIVLIIIIFVDGLVFELSDGSYRTFLVDTDSYVIKYDAYTLAAEAAALKSTTIAVTPQTEPKQYYTYSFMFELKSYNPETNDWILTPDNIRTIIKYEDKVWLDQKWIDKFCFYNEKKSSSFNCNYAKFSLARQLYDDFNLSTTVNEDVNTTDMKKTAMEFIRSHASYQSLFNPGVKDSEQASLYRSFYSAGLPIATTKTTSNGTVIHTSKFQNKEDRKDEQEQIYVDWAVDVWKEITVKHNGELTDGGLRITALCFVVYNAYFNVLLQEGLLFFVFAIVVVLAYMTFHLQSFFLASAALIEILMSFPLAYFFYRLVYQITHYDTLSSLIIFVLLGVGADDVFVFTDAWLQSRFFVPGDTSSNDTNMLVQRMTFSYRRAAKAMLVTQITTFFAFLATATSAIMPISGFGIWAATVVAMNYVLVITLYPALLLIHHKYVKKYEQLCFCCLCNLMCKGKCQKNNNKKLSLNTSSINNEAGDTANATEVNEIGDLPAGLHRQKSLEEVAEEYRCFERFLGVTWAKFIIKGRIYILIFFTLLFAIAAYGASTIEAQSEDEKWFNDDHYMQKAADLSLKFSAGEEDDLIEVNVVWGLSGVDRGDSSKWDPKDFGTVVYDNSFDVSSSAAQLYLHSVCNELKNSNLTFSNSSVLCFTQYLKDYLISFNLSFPWIYNETHSSGFTSFYEMLGAFQTSSFGILAAGNSMFYLQKSENTYKLRYVKIQANSVVGWAAGGLITRKERNKWNSYIIDISDATKCVTGVCNPFHVSLRWAWLATQTAFVTSAIQGILIAMPLAFVVLMFSTRNWIVALFAILDIVGIMLCELGVMAIMGWKFGVSESISIVIIIGFSVDYVVHLANAYLESMAKTRNSRLRFAFLTIGISVVSGAITTFMAGFFLIFPAIVFFQKMSVLMMTTVLVSIFWAMTFFMALLAQFGPENDTGSIDKYIKACYVKCKQCKERNSNNEDIEMTVR